MNKKRLAQVNYAALDEAKESFISASRKTLNFAKKYGFVPNSKLGGSANIFSLNIKPFLEKSSDNLYVSLVPEGLGTADDARPEDLNSKDLRKFWYNIAFKTLATMTNDVSAVGAQPILVSLYLPSSSPELVFNQEFREGFLSGFVNACKKVGCVYLSGETPQLRTKIIRDKIDIAGSAFGIIPPGVKMIDGEIRAGDRIVFIESSGPHENGFTALRKLATLLRDGYRTKLPDGRQYWEAINAPSVLYSPLIQDIISQGTEVSSIEPITGHGWQKLMRSRQPYHYLIEKTLEVPKIFKFIEKESGSSTEEMIKIFNYGVGIVIFVRTEKAGEEVLKTADEHKLKAIIAGRVESSKRREIEVVPFNVILNDKEFSLRK